MTVHPYKRFAFLCKVKEWSCEFGVVLDKVSVEVTESEEFLDVFDGFGLWPVFDGFEFNWVYA
jgi:hypothetical protein